MRTLLVVGGVIGVVSICAAGHYFLPADIHKEKQELIGKILSSDYTSAEMMLSQYRQAIPKEAEEMYRGYIARGKGEIENSDSAFRRAERFAREHNDRTTIQEAKLNLMLNAYLEGNEAKLEEEVAFGRNHFDGNAVWQDRFLGLGFYKKKQYAKALELFRKSDGADYLSSLMRSDFEKYLPTDEILLMVVRSEIEMGDFLEARRALQPLYQGATEKERETLRFLMGLSYFREAETKNIKEAVPYYKMAFDQFRFTPLQSEQYLNERKEMAKTVASSVDAIVQGDSFEEFGFYFGLLKEVGGKGEADRLRVKLLHQIGASAASGNWIRGQELLGLLNVAVQDENARKSLEKGFWEQFGHSLDDGDLASALFQFKAASLFCQKSCNEIEPHALDVVEAMMAEASKGSIENQAMEPYLELLGEMQTNRPEWTAVENQMLQSLDELWKKKGQREDALKLFKIIEQSGIAAKSSHFQKGLEQIFRLQAKAAMESGDLSELQDLWRAKESLELAFLDWNNTSEAKNWLSEAETLYEKKKFAEAKNKAALVLKADPKNAQAKKLMGLIAYSRGEYSASYDYLKDLPEQDESILRTMAVLDFLSGKDEMGNKLLEALKEKGKLTPEIYLEIAFAALTDNKPLVAMEWLQKAEHDLPEVLAGRCFASFEMNSWKETISLFDSLPKKYKRLDGFQGIAIESYLSLGKVDEGEKMLDQLLRMPPEEPISDFPDYFQLFIQNKLRDWNRNYVAATFYKIVKKDPVKALEYYNKIESPSFLAEIEKGELYLQQGDPSDAKEIFVKLLDEIRGEDQEKTVKKRLLPLLGATFTKLGDYYGAIAFYQEYLSLGAPEDIYRIAYAKALMEINRFDLALAQFEEMKKNSGISNENMVDMIESYVKTGQFDKAVSQARSWLSSGGIPLIEQMKACRYLLLTKNKEIVDSIFSRVQDKEIKTLGENEQLILLRMELGDYEQALNLSDTVRRGLESSPEGLMVLARLYSSLSKEQDAIDFAESALNYDPSNPRILSFIEKQERDLEALARKIKDLKGKLEQDPGNITLQLDYSKNLINLSIEMAASGEISDIKQSSDLQTASAMLEKLEKDHKEFPELYFLLGKADYLLDKEKEAISNYETALKLDVSYVEALQYLALIYEGKKELNKAVELVQKAATFDPSNPEIWLQLAGLYSKEGMLQEAADALKNAIRFAPNAADPYIKIAEVYLESKNPQLAIDNLNRALELSPKNIQAIELMILSLYDKNFTQSVKDAADLEKVRLRYFDKLQALDPEEAKGLRKRLGVKEE